MPTWLTRRTGNLLGLVACIGVISYALFAQYGLRLEPCPLCMLQRVAVIGVGVLFLLALLHNPGDRGARVYGALNGVRGIAHEDFADLSQETTHNLEQVALTPSSALPSTRDKPDTEYCAKIFEVCKAHEVRYFFYIGGNDSSDTVRLH